jgi:hypothetical protein
MPDDIRQRSELRALRRRAYEELNLAVDQSGDELPSDWLKDGDHDLQALRDMKEPEWLLLVRRQTGAAGPEDPQFPGSAWSDPHRRRNEWLAVGLGLFVLAVIIVVAAIPDEVWIGVGGIAALAGLALIWTLARHRGLILGGIVLAGAAIYGLIQAPTWVRVVIALSAATVAALYRSNRAATLAEAADQRAVALWNRRQPGNEARTPDGSTEPTEPGERADKPTGSDPPPLS